MTKIDEWNPVLPQKGKRSKQPNSAAKPLAKSVPDLVGAIYSRLASMEPRPNAVHFYLGEGLRWIRVGFDGDEPIKPTEVKRVGQLIETCIETPGTLYFHALRPYDMLFFLEGGEAESESLGMPAGCLPKHKAAPCPPAGELNHAIATGGEQGIMRGTAKPVSQHCRRTIFAARQCKAVTARLFLGGVS